MSKNVVKLNKILGVLALGLIAVSVFTYGQGIRRAERFERGQKFLPNLNPDEIAEIKIDKGDVTTHLRREGDRYVVVSANGYRAANESVNRFVRDVLDLGLEKEIGVGDGLRAELGLDGEGTESTAVSLLNGAGNEMVGFVVGNAFEDGGGNYLVRTDVDEAPIYLSSERVYLTTDGGDFVDKEIVDVAQSEVAAIRGVDFSVENAEGVLSLVDVPAGKQESSSKMTQVKGVLSGLRFVEHHLANDPATAGVRFTEGLEIDLQDGSGYTVRVGSLGDKHYLRIESYHLAEQVQIALDASEDEVRETSEVLARRDEVDAFNAFHGSWIYEVSDLIADKVRLRKADLVEDA